MATRARIQGHAAQALGKTREDVALTRRNVEQALRSYQNDDSPSPETCFRVAWHLAEAVGRVEMTAHTLVNCYGSFTPGDWRARLQKLGDEPGSHVLDPVELMQGARERLAAIDRLLAALYDELRGLALPQLGNGSISDSELAQLTADWGSAERD